MPFRRVNNNLTFTDNIAKKVALNVVKPILNKKIKQYNPQQLYQAIFENRYLWDFTNNDVNNQTKNLKKRWGNIYFNFESKITPDLLIEHWLKKDRPDLYAVIMDDRYKNRDGVPIGKIWFIRQVEGFKEYIRKE